ncbi:MAG: hypothetical protein HZA06_04800 [Nitrospirae bacterium]|nr:hypothetical protein [Nitrospirota bacterium]
MSTDFVARIGNIYLKKFCVAIAASFIFYTTFTSLNSFWSNKSRGVAIAGNAPIIKDNETIWPCGGNISAQHDYKALPIQILGLTDVITIACGGFHTIALKNDGTVWAWKNNEYGQLGDGSKKDKTTPVQIPGLKDITAIEGGMFYTAVLKDGEVVGRWGEKKLSSSDNWFFDRKKP